MSKIALIAKLTAADGKSAEVEEVLRGVCAAASEEDGLEIYAANSVDDEAGVYYFYEVYRDADALAVHGKGDAMSVAMGAFKGLLAGRPEVTRLTPVAAKGIDL